MPGVWSTRKKQTQTAWRRTLRQTQWVSAHFTVSQHDSSHRLKSSTRPVLGVYILTVKLIPPLEKSRDPRVVGLQTRTLVFLSLCVHEPAPYTNTLSEASVKLRTSPTLQKKINPHLASGMSPQFVITMEQIHTSRYTLPGGACLCHVQHTMQTVSKQSDTVAVV